jgi:hypothetical protein
MDLGGRRLLIKSSCLVHYLYLTNETTEHIKALMEFIIKEKLFPFRFICSGPTFYEAIFFKEDKEQIEHFIKGEIIIKRSNTP